MVESIIKKIKENKKTAVYILVAALGVIMLFLSYESSGGESSLNTDSEYEEKLESEIEKLCSSVDGVGKCKVFITFKRGEQNTYKGSNLIETKPPEVLGVTVVCRGGDSEAVKQQLSEMLSALFDIGYNRIAIMKLNS